MTPEKASADDFGGRFREIISDPINLLIRRVPDAGCVHDGRVVLHNGNRVAFDGAGAYYGEFSRILVYNRGVHEPLEEYAFQEVLSPCVPALFDGLQPLGRAQLAQSKPAELLRSLTALSARPPHHAG